MARGCTTELRALRTLSSVTCGPRRRRAGMQGLPHARTVGRARHERADGLECSEFRHGRFARMGTFAQHAEALEAVGLWSRRCRRRTWSSARRNWELWSKGADDEVTRQRSARDVGWHHNIGLGTPHRGHLSQGPAQSTHCPRRFATPSGLARVEIEDVRDLSSTEVLVLKDGFHLEGRGSGAAVTTPFGAVHRNPRWTRRAAEDSGRTRSRPSKPWGCGSHCRIILHRARARCSVRSRFTAGVFGTAGQ